MVRIIGEAGFARLGALKTLACAVAGRAEAEALVAAGGLKGVFPALMGAGAAHTRALHGAAAARKEDEYAAAIVAALLEHLPRAPPGAAPRARAGLERLRVVSKFLEAGGEKVRRVVELRCAYAAAAAGGEDDEDEDDEDDAPARGAAFTLARLDQILASLVAEGADGAGDESVVAVSRAVAATAAALCADADIEVGAGAD
jgi:hypothetical protein